MWAVKPPLGGGTLAGEGREPEVWGGPLHGQTFHVWVLAEDLAALCAEPASQFWVRLNPQQILDSKPMLSSRSKVEDVRQLKQSCLRRVLGIKTPEILSSVSKKGHRQVKGLAKEWTAHGIDHGLSRGGSDIDGNAVF